MANSYTSCLMHYVFSTKSRRKAISAELRERLWPFLGGIARNNDMKTLTVGGTDDHVHILVSLPAALSVAKGIQLIKGGSSKWIHETFSLHADFAWQEGYGAFSIGMFGVADTVRYIDEQEEHHRTRTFEDEYLTFLRKHDVEYDDRYVFG